MKKYLLDSSVVVDYTKGKSKAVNAVNILEGEVYSSYIVMAELYEGIIRSENEVEEDIVGFLESLDGIVGVDKATSKQFGIIRAYLKKRGEIIEDMDIMIAATCISNNLILITSNKKHFQRVKGLEVLSPEDFEN